MMNKKLRFPIILLMVLVILVYIPFYGKVYADSPPPPRDVYNEPPNILKGLSINVAQDGYDPNDPNDKLDVNKDITITIEFSFPVLAGGESHPNVVLKGDYADFNIIEGPFEIKNMADKEMIDGLRIGTVTYSSTPIAEGNKLVSRMKFDGEDSVYDGSDLSITEPKVKYTTIINYNPALQDLGAGDHEIVLLGKTYTINVPEAEVNYSSTKTNVPDLAGQEIEWTVTQNGEKQTNPVTNIDLKEHIFSDNLTNVGEYVADSFMVGTSAATLVQVAPEYDTNSKLLKYTFPNGSTGPMLVRFRTKIPDSKYFVSAPQTISNTSELFKPLETIPVTTSTVNVTYDPKWIKKEGKDDQSSGSYDPANRSMTWTITANEVGATMNDVIVTDRITPPLESLTSVKLQRWIGNAWSPEENIDIADTNIYDKDSGDIKIGDINTRVQLTLKTKVEALGGGSVSNQQTVNNAASLRWAQLPDGNTLATGNVSAVIGYNALAKKYTAVDRSKGEITWELSASAKGQNIPAMTIVDLLVYGKTQLDFVNDTTLEGLPSFLDDTTNKAVLNNSQSLSMKYIENSYTSTAGLTMSVSTITKNGVAVADLLVVSGLSDLPINDTHSCTIKTKVTDPNIFSSNTTPVVNVTNISNLFTANSQLNRATATVPYDSDAILKDAIALPAALDITKLSNINSASGALTNTFNYKDKTAIFRLHVNANNMALSATEYASGSGMSATPLGGVTISDKLPIDWEFVEISPGNDYLVYKGVGNVNGTVTAGSAIPETGLGTTSVVSPDKSTISVNFPSLDQAYVILFKAKIKNDQLTKYFSDNKNTTIRNNAEMIMDEGNVLLAKSYKDVTVKSAIITKTVNKPVSGVLHWTVEYKPTEIGHTGASIADTLPIGVDLRIKSNGTLDLPGNITVTEIILKEDGSYAIGSPVELILNNNIFYDNATRKLTFKIPDSTKSYRLVYITDITGDPGSITNKVQLLGDDTPTVNTGNTGSITVEDSKANLNRAGYIRINKNNEAGVAMAGAGFTIFAADRTTIIRTATSLSTGVATLRMLPAGEYILKETSAPAGYAVDAREYNITVTKDASNKVTTYIDGQVGNAITVNNVKSADSGNLIIENNVAGNAGDKTKKFFFNITLSAPGTFAYIGKGIPNGTITNKLRIGLAHGEGLTIMNLPKDSTYTIEEESYAGEGYTSSGKNTTGTILGGDVLIANFVNTKNIATSTSVSGGGYFDVAPEEVITYAKKDTDNKIIPSNTAVPKTGDDMPLVAWVAILVISIIGVVTILMLNKPDIFKSGKRRRLVRKKRKP